MNDGKWVTLKDGRRIFINTNKYMNDKIRKKDKTYNIPDDILTRTYNSRRNPYNEKFADFYIAEISPDDFLKLTTTEEILKDITNDKFRNFDLNIETLNKSYMFLEMDMKTGKITSHEGRHRMVALKNAGYKKAQIIMFPAYGTSDRYNPETYYNKKVTNQMNNNFSTTIKKITPMNKENYEKEMKER